MTTRGDPDTFDDFTDVHQCYDDTVTGFKCDEWVLVILCGFEIGQLSHVNT